MADETDNVNNLLESPKAPSQQHPQSSGEDGALEDILTQPSRNLIHEFATSMRQSAAKEASKTEEFTQELKKRLFRAIIDTYVWSTARLTHEVECSEERLSKGVQGLLSAERDQGMSSPSTRTIMDRLRARLLELMAAVNRAVEMFVG